MAATIPNKMAAPTRNSVVIDPATQATTVTIDWAALDTSNSGGSPVTGYYIRRNNGYNTSIMTAPSVTIPAATTLTHTFTSELLIGVNYTFVIAALNDVYSTNAFSTDGSDYVTYSDELVVLVANIP